MNAGKTKFKCGARIQTTRKWDRKRIITGTITHPFGAFGAGAVAGIRIDRKYHKYFGEVGNLYRGDFKAEETKKRE